MNNKQSLRTIRKKIVYLLFCLLPACGDTDSSVAMHEPGGGIDGTGYTAGSGNGDITGFGSVIFGRSEYLTTADTAITIDGLPVNETDLALGMVAHYLVAADAAPDFTLGTAQRIAVSSLLKGPVTSLSPLAVLGQTVLIDGKTQCESQDCATQLGSLAIGDIATVYGYQGNANIVYATRFEINSTNIPIQWKLSGWVDAVSPNTLTLSNQVVNLLGVSLANCAPDVGDYVTILANPESTASFSELNHVESIRCGRSGIELPGNVQTEDIAGRVQGIVSGYLGAADSEMFVGGQVVFIDTASMMLEFENGTASDLANGVSVSVEGLFNTITQVLTASEIEFRHSYLEMKVPVDPATIDSGNNQFEVMGIPVLITEATSDEVGLLGGGLVSVRQLAIKVKLDGSMLIAEEIRDEGVAKFDEVSVEAPVTKLSSPASFELLGVPVLLGAGTLFYDETEQLIAGGATEFFSLVSVGDIVNVVGELTGNGQPQLTVQKVELE